MRGESPVINGDGSQTRSFCYVDDTVDGLLKLSTINDFGPFNLGNPNEISIKYLSEKIINLTGSKSNSSFIDLPEDDPLRRKPDISKAENILNWKPVVSLDDGLKKTIEYFKK